MVHFMRPSDGFDVTVVQMGKIFKSLVNDNFMNNKIGKTIQRNTNTNIKSKIVEHASSDVTISTWNCKNQEKAIVFFEETWFNLMMVFV